mgnify:CR=1 FL=1
MASQAYFLSPVSSLPAISEALTADAENGSRAAVKTKMDKCFIVPYSLKLNWGLEEGIKCCLKFQTVHFYLTTKAENNLRA